MISMVNPFYHGNPVSHAGFVGRKHEVRRVAGRIVNQGQSTAIIGGPRCGKTSLLLYLAEPEMRNEIFGEPGKQLLFSYLDAQTLSDEYEMAQFWQRALRPLYQEVIVPEPESPLAQAYRTCQKSNFSFFLLERLVRQLAQSGLCLVLMLDEFEVLLHHPVLNSAEFFGGLRGLVSRSRGALALIIASDRPLESLNREMQELSRTGSPYLNFLSEISLRALPSEDIDGLLDQDRHHLTAQDRRFIQEVAGGHPYLVQVAGSALWEAYADGETDAEQRFQRAGQALYRETQRDLHDTWQLWSPETRRALSAVGLAHLNVLREQGHLFKSRRLDLKRLIREMNDYEPELRGLERQGFVVEDRNIPGGWRVRPLVLLSWLGDMLLQTARDPSSLEWQSLLKPSRKESFNQAIISFAREIPAQGPAFVEGIIRGVITGMTPPR